MVFSLVCPAPLVVLGLRQSLGRAVLGVAAATIIIAAFTGVLGAFFLCLGLGFLGRARGAQGRRYAKAVELNTLRSAGYPWGARLLLMVIAVKLTGINPFGLDEAQIMPMVERFASIYSSMGMSGESISSAMDQMQRTLGLIPLIFPALLVMASTVDCFLSYAVSAVVLRRLGREALPRLPEFSHWRFPKSVFWALLVSIGLHAAGIYFQGFSFLERAGLNLRLLITVIFFFQGLAVAWYLMETRGFGRFARFGVTALIFLISFLAQITLILGIIDMWFDLRSRFRGGKA